MDDKWMLKGVAFANCNCAFGCPCQFNSPTTYGSCEAVASYIVNEGYFNDTSLDGVKFVMVLQWPGEVKDGNGKQQLIIDPEATTEQREAIEKIALGESTEPGSTHFYIYNSTMSEVYDTLYEPIEVMIDIDGRRAETKVEGIVESKGVPLKNPFTGEDKRAAIHLPEGFEYTYAEMGSGTSKTNGMIKLDLKESYGQFSELKMNQDGVIR
ncbi:MAG: DUF1326 domain-containing protein [Pyrinomonadaceae bacterium]|nr:DUF1326 domain-containing protein [Pyrinomonadaceae bacterium]